MPQECKAYWSPRAQEIECLKISEKSREVTNLEVQVELTVSLMSQLLDIELDRSRRAIVVTSGRHFSIVGGLPPQNHTRHPGKMWISIPHHRSQTYVFLCGLWVILSHPQVREPCCLPGRVFMNSRFLGEESRNRCLGREDDPGLMKDFIKTDKEEYKQGRCPWIKQMDRNVGN